MNYQVAKYAKAKGYDPELITDEEREILREEMMDENYPGKLIEYHTG